MNPGAILRVFAFMFLVLPAASPVSAIQNPQDVTFQLVPRSGTFRFRTGEEIVLEFRLSTTTPKRYVVEQLYRGNYRTVRGNSPFVVEPATGTVDPMIDTPALFDGYGGGVMSTEAQFLGDRPLVSQAILNESVSFRMPGRYRVTAKSRQIGILLQSNTIELEIVAAEPGWAEAKLREAVAILRSPNQVQWLQAARTLRFLDTLGAAEALAEFFAQKSNVVYVEQQLRLGLLGSPYRKEIVAAMESDLDSTDMPIDKRWMDALIELAAVTITGPRPLPPARTDGMSDVEYRVALAQWNLESDRYQAQWPPVARQYYDRLARAVEGKQGQARTVSLETLANRPR
jgi:hypothetical protein